VDAVTKGWVRKWKANNWIKADKKKALNIDLWERMLELLEKHKVIFVWVKGHADNVENERCDFLARQAIAGGDLIDDEGFE
jgi:ribonuclease HI